jgi:hypothetical protein
VTAETINVPAQPAADRPADVAPEPAGEPTGPLWRRTWWRAVGVPLTVLAPIVALAPTADHRFNIYWHGGMFRDNPLRIVTHTIGTMPGYLGMGNFRPLGRMVEKSLDLAAYTLGDLFGLPANVAFRLVSFASAIVLTVAAVLLAESVVARGRLFRRPPSRFAAVVPFAVGGGFIAAGTASPVILFGGLYLLSAALVLGVAAAACRVDPDRARLGWWRAVLLVAGGATLACVNEVAYLALPFATAAVLLRGRLVLGLGLRRVLTNVPARVLGLLWLGFLPVFGTVRAIIYGYCSDGECYRGSDIVLGPAVLAAAPVRLVAWLPPLMWGTATDGGSKPWLAGLLPILATVVLAVLAWLTIRDLPRLSTVDRGQALGLAGAVLALLVLGATLGALNGDVQDFVVDGRWGQGWRDTAVTAVAGALLLVALVQAVSARRAVAMGLVLVLAGSAVVSAAANKRYADRLGSREPAILANRIAQEMAEFDRGSTGDLRRCVLRAEFFTLYADSAFSLRRFDQSLDVASRQIAGVPFCSEADR